MSLTEAWSLLRVRASALLSNIDRVGVALPGNYASGAANEIERAIATEAHCVAGLLRNVLTGSDIPIETREQLQQGVEELAQALRGLSSARSALLFGVRLSYVVSLFDYSVVSTEEPRRSRVDLAFDHLNRSLVVDPALRQTWMHAFGKGETECERLGAVHLLWHGIYAFKVNGHGARTDLVFQGDFQESAAVRGSTALVLTEWKLVGSNDDAVAIARGARAQAQLYSVGLLRGVEIRTRYIVLVSQRHIADAPLDLCEHDITYRHINIVTHPESPSVAGPKLQRRAGDSSPDSVRRRRGR
jgi:hypothetical protein